MSDTAQQQDALLEPTREDTSDVTCSMCNEPRRPDEVMKVSGVSKLTNPIWGGVTISIPVTLIQCSRCLTAAAKLFKGSARKNRRRAAPTGATK